MILTFFMLNRVDYSEDVHPKRSLSDFPRQVGEWSGKEDFFEESVYSALGVDDSFLGHYRTPGGRYIQLYIGYHQSQREGDLIHSPKNCMPGGGWNITRSKLTEVKAEDKSPGNIKVVHMDLENGPDKQMVLYWYHSRGRIINSEYLQKIYLVLDAITRQRTDGSFIRLIAPVSDGDEERTLKDLKKFARLILPILDDFIPA